MQNVLRQFEDRVGQAESRLTAKEKEFVRSRVSAATVADPVHE